MAGPLDGRVALVTGASKNIGKGMALEVAASGATTYLTARTLSDAPDQLGSLERTAAEIEAAGGTAVPLACDHTDDAQVEAVFDHIADEQGRLDVVVNVASPDFSEMVGVPFWERPLDDMTRCLEIGPRSNFATTVMAARRFMIPQHSGVVINISSHGADTYLLSVAYGAGKAAIDRITRDTALELQPHGVAVVSLWPGLVLTEGLLANTTVAPDGTRQLHGSTSASARARSSTARPSSLSPLIRASSSARAVPSGRVDSPASTASRRTTGRCHPSCPKDWHRWSPRTTSPTTGRASSATPTPPEEEHRHDRAPRPDLRRRARGPAGRDLRRLRRS
jgi:NAD(P)-dependent dehydrogenase (short-subunit alcohol dehydrogenase family)